MTQSIDRLVSDETEPGTEEEYRALVRSLRRKRGFGLFFVQASPAKAQDVLVDLQRDLPQKRVAQVMLTRSDERLFEQLEEVWEQERVDVFWIEGLEQSLLGYEDVNRLAGWSEQDLMTYSWKDVPPILSHLNLGRERFESRFDCALVFVVPLFVVKYLLRRAGDFFDWKSGFFEFPDDRQALAEQVINDGDYDEYLKLGAPERLEKILKIRDLLDAPEIEGILKGHLFREIGRLFESGEQYKQALTSNRKALAHYSDCHTILKANMAWYNNVAQGNEFRALGRYEEAAMAYQQAIKLNPKKVNAYILLGFTFNELQQHEQAIETCQRAIEINPEKADSYVFLGYIYDSQKKHKKAIAAFKKAIKLNPQEGLDVGEHNKIRSQISNIYLKNGQPKKALKELNQASKLNPENDWTYYIRAIAYLKLNQTEPAKADLQQAISIAQATQAKDTTDWKNNFNLALYYLAAGQFEESNRLYNRASEASTDSIEDAIRDLDDYLTLFPDRLQARDVRDRLSALV